MLSTRRRVVFYSRGSQICWNLILKLKLVRMPWLFAGGGLSCLHKRHQATTHALAKLAFAQRLRQGFYVRNAVDGKVRKVRVGRKQMKLRIPQYPHSQRLAQLKVIDAKQFQALLSFREHSPLQLQPLRGNSVMNAPALQIKRHV